jgi:type IV secretory pathway VirB6-like protein
LLGKVAPWLNVIVAFMPAEAHFEKVWWISMLQGVLIAAFYMCILAKEVPREDAHEFVCDATAGDGGTASAAEDYREHATAMEVGKRVDAGESC